MRKKRKKAFRISKGLLPIAVLLCPIIWILDLVSWFFAPHFFIFNLLTTRLPTFLPYSVLTIQEGWK